MRKRKIFIRCLFVSLFFQGFSPAHSIESSYSTFSFFLILSASVDLGQTVTYCGLKGMFLCESVPVQTAGAQCLVEELSLIWIEIPFFLRRVHWQFSPW